MTEKQRIGDHCIKVTNLILDSLERHRERIAAQAQGDGKCPGCGEYLSGSMCCYSDSERNHLCTGPDNDGCTFCGEAVTDVCKHFKCSECGWTLEVQADGEGVQDERTA